MGTRWGWNGDSSERDFRDRTKCRHRSSAVREGKERMAVPGWQTAKTHRVLLENTNFA